jgi:hypothetical protein
MKNIIHRNTIFDLNFLKLEVTKNFYDLVDNELIPKKIHYTYYLGHVF